MNTQAKSDAELLRKRNNLRWPLRAKIVLEKYRLNARDLEHLQSRGRDGLRTKIVNVSLEGVEELRVLLHLEGFSKPLRLTPQQRQQLSAIFQSHHFSEWIGHILELTIAQSRAESLESNRIDLSITSITSASVTNASVTNVSVTNASVTNASVTNAVHQSESAIHPPDIGISAEEGLTSEVQHPEQPQSPQHRMPRTHFSGVGQEFSVLDSNATPQNPSNRSPSAHQQRSPLLGKPAWLQQIGKSKLLRQLRLLFDTNVVIALILFLIVMAAVQFETIIDLLASLFGQ